MTGKEIRERDAYVASQITGMIKQIAYGKDFASFRASQGSRGVIEHIIKLIDKTFGDK